MQNVFFYRLCHYSQVFTIKTVSEEFTKPSICSFIPKAIALQPGVKKISHHKVHKGNNV
jgi:hypothetical protein